MDHDNRKKYRSLPALPENLSFSVRALLAELVEDAK